MTDADLLHALRDCYAPRLNRNIVDLRLVRSAHLTRDLDAPGSTIPGVPPPTDEAANAQLSAQIENRLLGLESISRVHITLLPALFPIL